MSVFVSRPTLRIPLFAVLAFAVCFTGLAGVADAKKKKPKKKSTLPTVTRIAPAKLGIGDRLTLRGKNFREGKTANTVIFRKSGGGPQIFVKTLAATKTRITLEIPERLRQELNTRNGVAQATRFKIRIIGKRANKKYTLNKQSPLVLPTAVTQSASPDADTDGDGIPDSRDPDIDGDGLSNALELAYKLDPYKVDTDGDGLEDGWEFESALDMNDRAVPYPWRTPWPNPLVNEKQAGGYTAATPDGYPDFDGDGLSSFQEHELWVAAGRPFPLNYSDGTQHTGGFVRAPSPDVYGLDQDAIRLGTTTPDPRTGVGYLSDDERDFDGDGLSNMVEYNTRMTPEWWSMIYAEEPAYPLRPFVTEGGLASDPRLADTDGDGIIDSEDDIDGDGWSNAMELYRAGTMLTNGNAYMVNPFNPCLPDYTSRACSRYVSIESPWAPFHLSALPQWPIGWLPGQGVPRLTSPTPKYCPVRAEGCSN